MPAAWTAGVLSKMAEPCLEPHARGFVPNRPGSFLPSGCGAVTVALGWTTVVVR